MVAQRRRQPFENVFCQRRARAFFTVTTTSYILIAGIPLVWTMPSSGPAPVVR